ncbi:2-C-methyl-D-erythritol 2,4-cyclodiphosphate synthase [bacterium]|nr:2-C-methyl-D-erythritol 2,4-cyclodiphosphate synthase [bacterium]
MSQVADKSGQKVLRIGHGIDIHPFQEGRVLFLGGVEIHGATGLKGHSDADVVLHALVDAMLGAMSAGDIGTWFPDTDPQWKDASSTLFVKAVVSELLQRNYMILNVDICILAEQPKISPYRDEIRDSIARMLRVSHEFVGIKATTAEGLGFVGRKEGILATATVLIEKKR